MRWLAPVRERAPAKPAAPASAAGAETRLPAWAELPPELRSTPALTAIGAYPLVLPVAGTLIRQVADGFLSRHGIKAQAGLVETLDTSLARSLVLQGDNLWFTPTGEVLPDLVSGALRQLGPAVVEFYGAARMVLSAAGKVDHGELVRHAEAQFGAMNGGEGGRIEPARFVGGTRTSAKPFEQSHLVMAFSGPSYRSPEFYTAQVFSGLFGGGMSSRLFQEGRERRGLCYAIYSSCWALADAGLFGIHAATGPEMMGTLIDVVGQQLTRAAAEKPDEAELARSKAQLKAGLLMGLESSSARAEQMARQLLVFDRLIGTPEIVERIEQVSAEAVRELAAKLVGETRPAVAVVGAGRKGESYAAKAERMASAQESA